MLSEYTGFNSMRVTHLQYANLLNDMKTGYLAIHSASRNVFSANVTLLVTIQLRHLCKLL